MRFAAWQLGPVGPLRGALVDPNLERDLHDWIEQDPSLIEEGVRIVGREVPLEAGRLDLLAIDRRQRWLLIEIKRSTLYRETVAQVLDYAAAFTRLPNSALDRHVRAYLERLPNSDTEALYDGMVADLSPGALDDREVLSVVVGTSVDAGLERVRDYLLTYRVPIETYTLSVVEWPDGSRVLIREASEEPEEPQRPATTSDRQAQIMELARRNGADALLDRVIEGVERLGLYPRAYVRSVMVTPATKRNRALFVVTIRPNGLRIWRGAAAVEELMPGVSAAEARRLMGPDGWSDLTEQSLDLFLSGLEAAVRLAERQSESGSGTGYDAVESS